MVVSYPLLGTTDRSHLQGSSSLLITWRRDRFVVPKCRYGTTILGLRV